MVKPILKEKNTTVSIGRGELCMLQRLSLYSCQPNSTIINNLISELYEACKPYFQKIEETGEILTFGVSKFVAGCGIDTVSGTYLVPFDLPKEESDKMTLNLVNQQFDAVDRLKERRKAMFAAKRSLAETPISDILSNEVKS